MKKHLIIDRDVMSRLTSLSSERRVDFWKAVGQLSESFGRPHIHAGIGIRKLGMRLFEFRLGIELRVLFLDRDNDLYLAFLGSHDEVRKEIRSGKLG